MATGDMKARLLLDSKDFEKNIKKTTKQTKDLKDGVDNAGGSIKKMTELAGKIGAAIAAAKVAVEAFKKVIATSQTLTDNWERSVAKLDAAWQGLLKSTFNSSFTGIADGLENAISRAAELYNIMDNLANIKISVGYITKVDTNEISKLMTTARDKTLSLEERRAAAEKAKEMASGLQSTAEIDKLSSIESAKAQIAAVAGVNKNFVNLASLDEYLRLSAADLTGGADVKEAAKEASKEYREKMKELRKWFSQQITDLEISLDPLGDFYGGSNAERNEMIRRKIQALEESQVREMENLQADYAESLIINALYETFANEELKEFSASLTSYTQTVELGESKMREANEVLSSLSAEEAAAIKAATKAAQELAETRREMAILGGVRPLGGMAGIKYAKTSTKPGSIAMLDENPAARAQEFYMSEWLKPFEEDAKRLEDINGVVGMLSGSFASLGSNIEGTAGNMLTFVGSTLEAVQAVIPLIGYIQAETVMRNKNATAAAKEAAAKTLSAYANIPFAGIALGVAAVAAIVGAMQSIPKFAEGGIVNRATLGVFGEAGPEAVMPLDKLDDYIQPRELRVTGNIKASGKELVVVLDNYNRVRNG
jgi:uncharacterized protein YukE